MVFDLEFFAQLFHHFVIEVETIIGNDFIRDPIMTYDLLLQETSPTCLATFAYETAFTHLVK